METRTEEWRAVAGYEGLYEVSNLGRVRKLANVSYRPNRWGTITEYHQKGKMLVPAFDGKKNYLFIALSKEGTKTFFTIHRLVAKAFIPNPDNLPQVNHKDENKTNNRADNLEWCTNIYNSYYGNHSKCKKVLQMDDDGNVIAEYDSTRAAAKVIGVDHVSIAYACRGKTKTIRGYHWKYKQ